MSLPCLQQPLSLSAQSAATLSVSGSSVPFSKLCSVECHVFSAPLSFGRCLVYSFTVFSVDQEELLFLLVGVMCLVLWLLRPALFLLVLLFLCLLSSLILLSSAVLGLCCDCFWFSKLEAKLLVLSSKTTSGSFPCISLRQGLTM